MDVLGPLIGTLGFLVLVAGLILFLPLRALRPRRPLAKKLAIGGAVAFVAGLIISPTPPPSSQQTAEREAVPEPTPSPTNSATLAVKPAVQNTGVPAEQKVAFTALYRSVIARAQPCDASVNQLSKAANSGNQMATYQAAKAGHDACLETVAELNDLDAPDGSSPEAEAAVDKALGICRNAYIHRQTAMTTAMEVADGDARPSKISSMSEDLKTAQLGVMLCVGELMSAAGKYEVDLKKL